MTNLNSKKSGLYGGTAVALLASAVFLGGTLSPINPVLADAVRVEAPQVTSFADVVEAVSPAVVSVRVKAKTRPVANRGFGVEGFGFDNLPEGHPLRRFFDNRGNNGPRFDQRRNLNGEKRRAPRRFGLSQGSGFFVSEDGYIVTNNHVVEGGAEFTIVMNNGDEISANLVGTDPKTDLAVLKVDADRKFTHVDFSEKASRVGEWVVAVGNPFGLGGTVTAGIVSANGRDIGSGPYDDFIQIDAAVNKGNSGGPAFNLNGEVIGVNTAIFSPSGGNVGIAFAISAKTAEEVVGDLIQNGSVTRGWLGVQIQPVTKDIAASLGLKSANGTIVADAQMGSPADKAGVKSGDVILKVDSRTVKGPKQLSRVIAAREPSDTIELTVFRDGKEQEISVTLGSLPGAKRASVDQSSPDVKVASVELEELGLSIAREGGSVVVSEVQENSAAAEKGIKPGDVVVSVNGIGTQSINDVGQAVSQALLDDRKAVLFQIKSGSRNRFVALPVAKG